MIGDIYERGAQNLVEAINKLPPGSGKACWTRCDVARWDDQVALFESAMTKFGGVDIVVSCSRCALSGVLMPDTHTPPGADGRLPVRELANSITSGCPI